MEINLLAPQQIFHYGKLAGVDEAAVAAHPDSIVIIGDLDKKHTQIRVLPFNTFNQEKNALSFVEKMQYFKKEVRDTRGNGSVPVAITPENTAVTVTPLADFFTPLDGLEDEFADFMDGFINNKPASGYGSNIDGLFGDLFIDISETALTELIAGLTPPTP